MKPDPSRFSAESRAQQYGLGRAACGGDTAIDGSLCLGSAAAAYELPDGESFGERLRFIQSILQLLCSGLTEDPSWKIPHDDLAEVCEHVGISCVPLTARGVELALMRLAPDLLRLARAPNASERQAWDDWKAAVERGDHMGAKSNLQLLGLLR